MNPTNRATQYPTALSPLTAQQENLREEIELEEWRSQRDQPADFDRADCDTAGQAWHDDNRSWLAAESWDRTTDEDYYRG